METITNVASAASRAIFGEGASEDKTQEESGTEPVSGVTGPGTAEKPYDAGNQEENPSQNGTAAPSTQPDLSRQGKPDNETQGGLTPGTSDTTSSSTFPSVTTGQDEKPTTTSSDSKNERDNTQGAGYATYLANKLDARDDSPRDESNTLEDKTSTSQSDTTNLTNPTGTETSKLDARDDSKRDDPTTLGDKSATLPSDTTNLATESSDDRSYGRLDPSAGTVGSASFADKPDASVDLPRDEPTTVGGSSSTIPSGTAASTIPVDAQRSYDQPESSTAPYGSTSVDQGLGARDDPQVDQPTIVGGGSSTLPSGTAASAIPADTQRSYGQSEPSTAPYGSTSVDENFASMNLGDKPTTLPSEGTNLMDPSDSRREDGPSESITGSDNTTTQSSTLQGSDDHHGGSTIGGDTSDRLPGQSDTNFAPSGGIAEGGIPQGRNVVGDVRPEHQTDKTGVTGIHSNDPKMTEEAPSSSNEPSTAPGGQSRAPAGGFGVVEPSVGADPSSGQKPMQKEQGADRPSEEPSEENEQAIREKKEAAEKAVEGEDLSGQPLGGESEEKYQRKEKGTGHEWVKSSGMAADGGDFDAAKPGAGREADRLLEQQGIHRSVGVPKVDVNETTEKHGLGEKIKEKLHIGHH